MVKAESYWEEGKTSRNVKEPGGREPVGRNPKSLEVGRKKDIRYIDRENNEGKREAFCDIWLCIINVIYSWPLLVGEYRKNVTTFQLLWSLLGRSLCLFFWGMHAKQ